MPKLKNLSLLTIPIVGIVLMAIRSIAPAAESETTLSAPPARIPNAAVQAEACIECHQEIADLLDGDKHVGPDFHCVVCHGESKAHLEMKVEGTLPDRAWRRWIEEEYRYHWRMEYASLEIAKFCASCHDKRQPHEKETKTMNWKTYLDTGHGMALTEGNRDAPTCTDCHYAHGAGCEPMTDEVIVRRCSLCHGDKEMMKRTGLDPDVIEDFQADKHESMSTTPAEEKTSCVSCHEVH